MLESSKVPLSRLIDIESGQHRELVRLALCPVSYIGPGTPVLYNTAAIRHPAADGRLLPHCSTRPSTGGGRHLAGCPESAKSLRPGRERPQSTPRDRATGCPAAGPRGSRNTAGLPTFSYIPSGGRPAPQIMYHGKPTGRGEQAGWPAGVTYLAGRLVSRHRSTRPGYAPTTEGVSGAAPRTVDRRGRLVPGALEGGLLLGG